MRFKCSKKEFSADNWNNFKWPDQTFVFPIIDMCLISIDTKPIQMLSMRIKTTMQMSLLSTLTTITNSYYIPSTQCEQELT